MFAHWVGMPIYLRTKYAPGAWSAIFYRPRSAPLTYILGRDENSTYPFTVKQMGPYKVASGTAQPA